MTVSDWIAALALAVASAALGLEVRRWFESRPRLFLSLMADAMVIPDDDGRPKWALTVANRGAAPTTLTHCVIFEYPAQAATWRRLMRRHQRPKFTAIANVANIPCELGVNRTWTGWGYYDDNLTERRKSGNLFVGVKSAHSKRDFLVRVPADKPDDKVTAPSVAGGAA